MSRTRALSPQGRWDRGTAAKVLAGAEEMSPVTGFHVSGMNPSR